MEKRNVSTALSTVCFKMVFRSVLVHKIQHSCKYVGKKMCFNTLSKPDLLGFRLPYGSAPWVSTSFLSNPLKLGAKCEKEIKYKLGCKYKNPFLRGSNHIYKQFTEFSHQEKLKPVMT